MAKVPTKVVNWLYSVIKSQYRHEELVYRDIYRFLAVYLPQGFRIRTAVYTSGSGKATLLIQLYGSVVISDNQVPVQIWVPQNYPFADKTASPYDADGVPLVYIVPSAEMVVRQSNNVDLQGRFYHPYLSLWYQNHVPGSASAEYSLLLLMGCMNVTFEKEMPLALRPITTGPELPPKPPGPRETMLSQTSGPRRETTGPSLPQKPDSGIPLKYRAPPPLPQAQSHPQQHQPQTRSGHLVAEILEKQRYDLSERHPEPQGRHTGLPQERHVASSQRHPGPLQERQATGQERPPALQNYTPRTQKAPQEAQSTVHASKPVQPMVQAEIEDLMDKAAESQASGVPAATLEKIARQINDFLSSAGINTVVDQANAISQRVGTLHSQLLHHHKQAEANRENLENHISYLKSQINAITDLNRKLGELDVINTEDATSITMSLNPKSAVAVDDVVCADLALVHQLYDVCADIKAHKDTINLVAGNFRSEAELINDDNIDACIKAVRGLAREAFWLEIERSQIGKAMGLLGL